MFLCFEEEFKRKIFNEKCEMVFSGFFLSLASPNQSKCVCIIVNNQYVNDHTFFSSICSFFMNVSCEFGIHAILNAYTILLYFLFHRCCIYKSFSSILSSTMEWLWPCHFYPFCTIQNEIQRPSSLFNLYCLLLCIWYCVGFLVLELKIEEKEI